MKARPFMRVVWGSVIPLPLVACGFPSGGVDKRAANQSGVEAPQRTRVAVVYTAEPALFRGGDGNVTGFLYDLELEVGRRLGLSMSFQVTSFENVITGVQSGRFDIGSGVDATSARQAVIDVVPFYQGSYSLLALTGAGKRVGGQMRDLCGLTIAVIAGGSDGPELERQSGQCVHGGERSITLLRFASAASALLAVKSRKVDAMTAYSWYPALPGTQLTGPIFSSQQTGVAVRKGSSLGPRLVCGINAMIEDKSYARILARYNVPQVALGRAELNPAARPAPIREDSVIAIDRAIPRPQQDVIGRARTLTTCSASAALKAAPRARLPLFVRLSGLIERPLSDSTP